MSQIVEQYGSDCFVANVKDESICQPFLAKGTLRLIGLYFQLRCEPDCKVCVRILQNGNVLALGEFFGCEVRNNYVELSFSLDLKPNEFYELIISFEGDVISSGIQWGPLEHIGRAMRIGSLVVNGELNVRFVYDSVDDIQGIAGDEEDRQRHRWMNRALGRADERRLHQKKMREQDDEEKERREKARLPGGADCSFGFDEIFDETAIGIDFNSVNKLDSMEEFLYRSDLKASIIILTKDHPDMLWECLTRIQKFVKYKPYEVVIGDTGSTDLKVDEVYRTLPPNFKVVRGLEYHFAKTNNYLAKEHATGSFLIFMNNDVYLERDDVVSRMVEALRVYPVGTVGIRLVRSDGKIDHDGQILFREGRIREPAHENRGKRAKNVPEIDGFVDGNTAAFMGVRREIFEAAGGFDEEYDDIYQDCDFALRVIGLGFKHFCLRSVSAIHLGSVTRGEGGSVNDLKRFMDRWVGFYFLGGFQPMFSFVTCCSDPNAYGQMYRTFPVLGRMAESIPVINFDNYFTVTEALNLGQRLSAGKWEVFCHQDVLYNESWSEEVIKSLSVLGQKSFGVLGFEGVRVRDDERVVKGWRLLGQPGYAITQTADEYCLIARRGQFLFDEQFRFHFYGADICLQSLNRGLINYIIYGKSEHISGGDLNVRSNPEAFKKEAQNLWRKWGETFPNIGTTTVSLSSKGLKYYICREIFGESESWPDSSM